MKRLWCLLAVSMAVASLGAEVTFSDLDLGASSSLLFQATHSPWSGDEYAVWYKSDLSTGSPSAAALEPMTFYPESTAWLPKIGQLQIQNGFGVWRLNPQALTITAVAPTSFERRNPLGEGRPLPLLFSPDGQSALTFVRVTPASGDLMLYDTTKDTSAPVGVGIDLSYQNVPALWSPDSQFFVYEKKGELYYYSLRQARENRVPEESLRRLGPGMVSSVTWSSTGELYYVVEDVLYRILPEEFFTRSLYKGQFQTWGIKGKLPFPFVAADDRFWIDPVGRTVLFNLGGRTLFYYPLDYLDFYQTQTLAALTYLPLPQNLSIRRVLWGKDGKITLLTSSLSRGKDQSQVLRLTAAGTQVLPVGTATVLDLAFSPDENWILATTTDGVSLREATSLVEKKAYPLPGLTAAYWADQNTLIAAGKLATVKIDLTEGSVKTLLLGTLDQLGTSDVGGLAGRQGKSWYLWQGKGLWKASGIELKVADPQTANASYRVYTGDLTSGAYRNWILVRNLKALSTQPLFPQPLRPYDAFPALSADSAPLGDGLETPFVHGSRLRAREVAITIDALDSPEGLPQALRAFRDWGFKTTFFVNGEFLRRNPQASQEIAQSPHDVGSLFHIPFDLSTPGYVIDASFIKQGLARQEDDWFHVTGKELSLLWHAPGWVATPVVLAGARDANYLTVGRDVAVPLDLRRSADVSKLIESILSAKLPGSIIPLTLGMKDSKTGESFFNRLELLLNALVESGYTVVPVSALLDKSRK